jgi:co-chaperonin GroES (HSP10)
MAITTETVTKKADTDLKLRPLRGRAFIQRDAKELGEYTTDGGIIVPATVATNPRKLRIHRGVVLALGPPAFVHGHVEMSWDCKVGDTVYFVFDKALEKVRNFEDKAWVAQEEIQGVYETVHDQPTDPEMTNGKDSTFRPGFDDDVADPFHNFAQDDDNG